MGLLPVGLGMGATPVGLSHRLAVVLQALGLLSEEHVPLGWLVGRLLREFNVEGKSSTCHKCPPRGVCGPSWHGGWHSHSKALLLEVGEACLFGSCVRALGWPQVSVCIRRPGLEAREG